MDMNSSRILEFINPATGEKFGQVSMCTPEEAAQSVPHMRQLARIWGSRPISERVRVMRRFQRVMLEGADEITAAINQDTGKSRQDALAEVFMVVELLHLYLDKAPKWLRRRRESSGIFFFKKAYVEPRPYGVVAIIAPWNYPFALAMQPVISALVAGNGVLLKPSEVTPAVGVMMEELFRRVPELTPFVRVLHGDSQVGAAIVAAAPDFIYVTGSTVTGQKVMENAAAHLTPVATELGGKDAMLVLEDADVEAAARWGAWGAYFNTGQSCVSVERAYVVEPVYDEFVRLAVEHTRRLKIGYTRDKNSPFYLGPISDPRQLKIIDRHLQDAQARGAVCMTGGSREGNFLTPIVMTGVNHDMLIMQEETFGPILPVMKVKDELEAIRLANDSQFGLGASVWSRDLNRAMAVGEQLETGTIVINDTVAHFAAASLPFGGIKHSGNASSHGKEGLLEFTRPLSILVGPAPGALDFTVLARKPGNYETVTAVMRFLFGVDLAQRLSPIPRVLKSLSAGPGKQLSYITVQQGQPQPSRPRLGGSRAMMLGLLGLSASALLLTRRRR
jgi:acyl-CoA reductase-like NAD-dependent aldehyde dehydrogenase